MNMNNDSKVSREAEVHSAVALDPKHERLSALMDGQLFGDDFVGAIHCASDKDGQASWEIYHLIGDVLRSEDLALPSNPAFLTGLRERLACESMALQSSDFMMAAEGQEKPVVQVPESANDSIFRWKMIAGFSALVAFAAVGLTSLVQLQESPKGSAHLANAPAQPHAEPSNVVAITASEGSQVMLRDPRLDELLTTYRQFETTSALQMPAGFLRNATFENSKP